MGFVFYHKSEYLSMCKVREEDETFMRRI